MTREVGLTERASGRSERRRRLRCRSALVVDNASPKLRSPVGFNPPDRNFGFGKALAQALDRLRRSRANPYVALAGFPVASYCGSAINESTIAIAAQTRSWKSSQIWADRFRDNAATGRCPLGDTHKTASSATIIRWSEPRLMVRA